MARHKSFILVIILFGIFATILLYKTTLNETIEHDPTPEKSAEKGQLKDLLDELKSRLGDEDLLKVLQRLVKSDNEILNNIVQENKQLQETEQDFNAPPALKNLREKGVSYGLANKDISKMTAEEMLFSFYSTLDQTNTVCHRKIRMGRLGDGGWEICDDPDVRPRQPCIIYSFGIARHWSFDDKSSATYGCHVYSFDPSINQKTYNRSSLVHFYKVGLGGKTEKTKRGWQLYTFKDLRKLLGHENQTIDVVKMDIEYEEYSAINKMFEDGETDRIKQISLEFHLNSYISETEYARRLRVVQMMEQGGFKVFYTHKNPALGCLRKDSSYPGPVTLCYEVHYVKRPSL